MTAPTTEPLSDERLAEIEDDTRRACLCDRLQRADIPQLLAEVRRLKAELAKYVGWEPTVKQEYDHARREAEQATSALAEARDLAENAARMAVYE